MLTKLHAGGKFGGEGYKVSGGLHGVGVSVVNALSEWLVAEVQRDGKVYRQEFARGEPTTDLKKVGADEGDRARRSRSCPTREIFEELEWSSETLVQRLRETAFLTKGLRIVAHRRARRATSGTSSTTRAASGTSSRYVNEAKEPVHKHIVYFEGENGDARAPVEVAMQWNTLVRRVGLLVREQHQHARGRLAPLRLQGRADAHAQRLRARRRACSRRRRTTSRARTCARGSPP